MSMHRPYFILVIPKLNRHSQKRLLSLSISTNFMQKKPVTALPAFPVCGNRHIYFSAPAL